jgi:hypothetical protein
LVVEQVKKARLHTRPCPLRHLHAQSRWPRTHSRLKQAHHAHKTSTIGQAHPFDRHLHAWPVSHRQTQPHSLHPQSNVCSSAMSEIAPHHKKVCLSRVNGLNDRVWISVLRYLVLHGQICARTRAKSFTTAYAGRGWDTWSGANNKQRHTRTCADEGSCTHRHHTTAAQHSFRFDPSR